MMAMPGAKTYRHIAPRNGAGWPRNHCGESVAAAQRYSAASASRGDTQALSVAAVFIDNRSLAGIFSADKIESEQRPAKTRMLIKIDDDGEAIPFAAGHGESQRMGAASRRIATKLVDSIKTRRHHVDESAGLNRLVRWPARGAIERACIYRVVAKRQR